MIIITVQHVNYSALLNIFSWNVELSLLLENTFFNKNDMEYLFENINIDDHCLSCEKLNYTKNWKI